MIVHNLLSLMANIYQIKCCRLVAKIYFVFNSNQEHLCDNKETNLYKNPL